MKLLKLQALCRFLQGSRKFNTMNFYNLFMNY